MNGAFTRGSGPRRYGEPRASDTDETAAGVRADIRAAKRRTLMHRKTAWFAGVAAAALLVGGAAMPSIAAAAPIPPAYSYADLLEPVPDATARLAVDDAMQRPDARLQTVQYWEHHHHHHHHHSWQWYRDNGYYWNDGGWALIPYYDHHHHARGWYEDRGYYWNGWAWAPRPHYRHHHHHHHHHHHQYWY
ncbi:hypothetical protein [Phenylobacterium sp.]|uniref:hypothetical protein n=1 Tax=Phenylobacterium sp. TaxID=1871053 RepID=UPI002B46AAD4|nr:hypothetical protein [Phenylobacterium sp.]